MYAISELLVADGAVAAAALRAAVGGLRHRVPALGAEASVGVVSGLSKGWLALANVNIFS